MNKIIAILLVVVMMCGLGCAFASDRVIDLVNNGLTHYISGESGSALKEVIGESYPNSTCAVMFLGYDGYVFEYTDEYGNAYNWVSNSDKIDENITEIAGVLAAVYELGYVDACFFSFVCETSDDAFVLCSYESEESNFFTDVDKFLLAITRVGAQVMVWGKN